MMIIKVTIKKYLIGGVHDNSSTYKFETVLNSNETYRIVSSQNEFNAVIDNFKFNIENYYNYMINDYPKYVTGVDVSTFRISDFYRLYGFDENTFDVYDYSSYCNIDWDKNSLLIVECCEKGRPHFNTDLLSFSENDNIADVRIYWDAYGLSGDISEDLYFIPVSKNISDANINYTYKKYKNTDIDMIF